MTKLEEIDATEKWVKESKTMDDGEKYRWLEGLKEMRATELKKNEVVPPTKEELDAVMNDLFPESRTPIASKPESEKTEFDRILDNVCKLI